MTWLIDFKGYSLRTAPPVRTQIQTTQMLQNHYPERLGLAVCYHAPRLFSLAYKVSSTLHSGQLAVSRVMCWLYSVSGRCAAIIGQDSFVALRCSMHTDLFWHLLVEWCLCCCC